MPGHEKVAFTDRPMGLLLTNTIPDRPERTMELGESGAALNRTVCTGAGRQSPHAVPHWVRPPGGEVQRSPVRSRSPQPRGASIRLQLS